MPLARLGELLADAQQRSAAVGAFTCYDLLTGAAVLAAAERRSVGVILLISAQASRAPTGPGLISGLRVLAERSSARCCLQLDHSDDPQLMHVALEAGVGALMADGSQLPYEQNVTLVGRALRLAARYQAAVEAELGHISGDEEFADEAQPGGLTDPDEAERFVRDTGADCLAVSIGNVHGTYRHPPTLDLARLHAIRVNVKTPLCLHGASGLSEQDIRRSVTEGIVKININHELRTRWFQTIRPLSEKLAHGTQLLALQRQLTDALRAAVDAKLAALEPPRGGAQPESGQVQDQRPEEQDD